VYGSAALVFSYLGCTFPSSVGMAQAVDGLATGKLYFEIKHTFSDIFSADWGGGIAADFVTAGGFSFWFTGPGSFDSGSNLGGALVTGQTLSNNVSEVAAIGSTLVPNAFNFATNDVIGVAIHIVPAGPPAVLNLDNVIVTSLLAESPCTVAQYGTPPLVSPAVGLRWSDTRGATFGNPVARTLGSDPLTQLQWNRTGYARDRVFELFWSAASETALNGAFLFVEPWKS
jgi:hypothetical protein